MLERFEAKLILHLLPLLRFDHLCAAMIAGCHREQNAGSESLMCQDARH